MLQTCPTRFTANKPPSLCPSASPHFPPDPPCVPGIHIGVSVIHSCPSVSITSQSTEPHLLHHRLPPPVILRVPPCLPVHPCDDHRYVLATKPNQTKPNQTKPNLNQMFLTFLSCLSSPSPASCVSLLVRPCDHTHSLFQ